MKNPISFLTNLSGKVPLEKLFASLDGRPVKMKAIMPEAPASAVHKMPVVTLMFVDNGQTHRLVVGSRGKNDGSDFATLDGTTLRNVVIDFDSITKPLRDVTVLQVEVRFTGTDNKPHEFRIGYEKKLGIASKILGRFLPF